MFEVGPWSPHSLRSKQLYSWAAFTMIFSVVSAIVSRDALALIGLVIPCILLWRARVSDDRLIHSLTEDIPQPKKSALPVEPSELPMPEQDEYFN